MKRRRLVMLLTMVVIGIFASHAFSLALDSVAQWGKFPRFCVNTYRWGDHFFNGYDTLYVKGTGYKFNAKVKVDSWTDYYNFDLPNNMRMRMLSDPSSSLGLYLTYLAVSIGYDKNISEFFGSSARAREQFQFGFNCSLFGCNLYYIDNKVGTKISKFGHRGHTYNPNLEFNGANTKSFGMDLYYFFSHKKYSQAAAFNFSRVQTRSHGSWFAGFSYCWQKFMFDFSDLPEEMKQYFPTSWEDYRYNSTCRNYAIKFGYGYNWVFAPHWLFGVSESPTIGLKKGFINDQTLEKTTFALSNLLRMAVVWNNGRWFAGLVGELNTGLIYDKDSTFENAVGSLTVSVGYRFNIW